MANSRTITQMMELRRAKWLEKLSHMQSNRNPRKFLVAWMPNPRNSGRPQQTIRHGYASSLEKNLGFSNSNLPNWIPIAQNHKSWARHVESILQLEPGTYKSRKNKDKTFSG